MDGVEGETPPGGLRAAWRTTTLVVVALLGAVVLIALIFTQAEANRQRDRALQLQSHSYDVMILARTLSGTIARSEASLGRYVLSSDKAMGQLYFDQWRLAGQQIDRLDQITDDNHWQQPEINALRRAYAVRGSELSDTALSTSYGRNGQALTRYYQSRKAPSLARINLALDRIIARERNLLDRRTSTAMASVAQSSQVTRVLAIFGILLVLGGIGLGWLTVRALTDRAIANTEAAAERERADELADAVRQATEELRTQEARLRQVQKMEAVGQLTGGIAHDFNNMLAVVIGGLELARRNLGGGSAVAARHLDSATEGAHRAAALTRQLLAFAREDAINPEPIDAGELIAGMRDMLDRTLGDAISVEVADDSAGWRVRADRVQLENTILNLAVNARDAMNGRGALTISATAATLAEGERACAAGEYLAIAVHDTGCGMTPEVMERVFEPFFTTKPVGKGTGLGLSQIFGFVRQLGGEVEIKSAPGAGSTVTLYLPRDTSAAPAVPVAELAPAAAPVTASRLVVLVVEDDPRVLGATLGALEELGHHGIACEDPLQAPAMLAGNPAIDLIISDVLMPHQTGPEMIAALGPDHAHVAVLFVTGYAGEAGEAGEFGGHHVLRKPFTLAKLERAIDTALGTERPAPPERLAAE